MTSRLNHHAVAPQARQALAPRYSYVKECGLDIALLDMIWLRISQINGCAYCVDLHYRDALTHGITARKLNSVVTWEETEFFNPRERAALAWAESLTLVAATRAPDDVYRKAQAQFSEKELVDLTYAIGLMNLLNRIGVGFRMTPKPEEAAS